MMHVKLVGLGIALLLVFIMVLVQLQKRRQQRVDQALWQNTWDDNDNFDEILGVRKLGGEKLAPTFDASETQAELELEFESETEPVPSHLSNLIEQINDEYFALYVVPSSEEEAFHGADLRQFFEERGYQHNEPGTFGLFASNGQQKFTVAQISEPGFFVLDEMDQRQYKGVTFFIEFYNSSQDKAYFIDFIDEVTTLAQELNAQVLEARQREKVTISELNHLPNYFK